MSYKLSFYTQYNQFYIGDIPSLQKIDDAKFWTHQAYEDRLAMSKGILSIGTECYGPVKGEITILDSENKSFVSTKFDHIVEGGIITKTGVLEVLDCPTNTVQLEVKVKPGSYRVRIYSSNLRSVEGDAGDDYYYIEIWPSENMERLVLKKYLNP